MVDVSMRRVAGRRVGIPEHAIAAAQDTLGDRRARRMIFAMCPLDIPAVRSVPTLAGELALERDLPLRQLLRIVELFDALDAVGSGDNERVAVGYESNLAADVSAALLEPPEHGKPPDR